VAFNVLVAEFGEQNTNGQVQSTTRGRELSQAVFDNLLAQRQEIAHVDIRSSIDFSPR
jgi:hypothetical protein